MGNKQPGISNFSAVSDVETSKAVIDGATTIIDILRGTDPPEKLLEKVRAGQNGWTQLYKYLKHRSLEKNLSAARTVHMLVVLNVDGAIPLLFGNDVPQTLFSYLVQKKDITLSGGSLHSAVISALSAMAMHELELGDTFSFYTASENKELLKRFHQLFVSSEFVEAVYSCFLHPVDGMSFAAGLSGIFFACHYDNDPEHYQVQPKREFLSFVRLIMNKVNNPTISTVCALALSGFVFRKQCDTDTQRDFGDFIFMNTKCQSEVRFFPAEILSFLTGIPHHDLRIPFTAWLCNHAAILADRPHEQDMLKEVSHRFLEVYENTTDKRMKELIITALNRIGLGNLLPLGGLVDLIVMSGAESNFIFEKFTHNGRITALRYVKPQNSDQPPVLFSSSADRTICCWDTTDGHCLFTLKGHDEGVTCFQMVKNRLLSGSFDNTVRIWDLDSKKCLGIYGGGASKITCLQVASDILFVGGWDMTVRAYHVSSRILLREFRYPGSKTTHQSRVSALCVASGLLCTGTVMGEVRIWRISDDAQCIATVQLSGYIWEMQTNPRGDTHIIVHSGSSLYCLDIGVSNLKNLIVWKIERIRNFCRGRHGCLFVFKKNMEKCVFQVDIKTGSVVSIMQSDMFENVSGTLHFANNTLYVAQNCQIHQIQIPDSQQSQASPQNSQYLQESESSDQMGMFQLTENTPLGRFISGLGQKGFRDDEVLTVLGTDMVQKLMRGIASCPSEQSVISKIHELRAKEAQQKQNNERAQSKAELLDFKITLDLPESITGPALDSDRIYSSADLTNEDLAERISAFRSELRRRIQISNDRVPIIVQRSQLLATTFICLSALEPKHLRHPFAYSFVNEEGIDAGGVAREYYEVFSAELLDQNAGLFVLDGPEKSFCSLNQNAPYLFPDHYLEFYRYTGIIVAKALFDGFFTQIYLSPVLHKLLLGLPLSFSDLQAMNPEVYNSHKMLLQAENVEEMCLDFTIEESVMGCHKVVELIPDGANVNVTDANKREFVERYCNYVLKDRYLNQIKAFLAGFYSVVPRSFLSIFRPEDMERLLCGSRSIDVQDLQRNTVYEDCDLNLPIVGWFWNIVRELSQPDLVNLLQFCTGNKNAPVGGFARLNPPFTLQITGSDPINLPSASTCTNCLKLPQYETPEQLRGKLTLAIANANVGFGME